MVFARRTCKWAFGTAAVLGLVLSLGVAAYPAEKIQFQNWWVWQPNTSPFWLAIDSGFYKAEGLDVNYVEGKGSSYAIQAVGANKADIGVSDLGTAAFGISKKTPIKAIFSFLQSGPQAVISHRETGIKNPKDLEGKRLAFGPADSGWILFPAFASANGIDMSKIIQVSAGPASMRQLLLAKKVDAILNYFTSVPEMASRGADLTYLRYADYKVSLLGWRADCPYRDPQEPGRDAPKVRQGHNEGVCGGHEGSGKINHRPDEAGPHDGLEEEYRDPKPEDVAEPAAHETLQRQGHRLDGQEGLGEHHPSVGKVSENEAARCGSVLHQRIFPEELSRLTRTARRHLRRCPLLSFPRRRESRSVSDRSQSI